MSRREQTAEEKAKLADLDALRDEIEQNGWPFRGQRLKRVSLAGMNLDGGEIADTDFQSVDISGATFTGTRFEDVNFEDCDLSESRFRNVEFRNQGDVIDRVPARRHQGFALLLRGHQFFRLPFREERPS
jgi:hypothetical protein